MSTTGTFRAADAGAKLILDVVEELIEPIHVGPTAAALPETTVVECGYVDPVVGEVFPNVHVAAGMLADSVHDHHHRSRILDPPPADELSLTVPGLVELNRHR